MLWHGWQIDPVYEAVFQKDLQIQLVFEEEISLELSDDQIPLPEVCALETSPSDV
jgi:hypothetical protein